MPAMPVYRGNGCIISMVEGVQMPAMAVIVKIPVSVFKNGVDRKKLIAVYLALI